MGYVCRAAILLALLSLTHSTPSLKSVNYLYDRNTNRKIGYVVTRVRAITSKEQRRSAQDNDNESVEAAENNAKTSDRTAFIDDGHDFAPYPQPEIHTQAPNFHPLPEPQVMGHEIRQDNFRTLTVIKKIAVPYPVEKTVHIPIVKKVPYEVKVPIPAPFPVEREIPVPVKVIVKVPVRIPKPVPIIKQVFYPVHVPVERLVPHKVYVPAPYPVEKKVHYEVKVPVPSPYPVAQEMPIPVKVAVHVPQPVPVEKVVRYPVQVEDERPYPVPVQQLYPVTLNKHVPYPVEKHVPYPVHVPVAAPSEEHVTLQYSEQDAISEPLENGKPETAEIPTSIYDDSDNSNDKKSVVSEENVIPVKEEMEQ